MSGLYMGAPLASELDRAGVPHWRKRLKDATKTDDDERRRGVSAQTRDHPHRHFDDAWALVKAEYRRLTAGDPPRQEGE